MDFVSAVKTIKAQRGITTSFYSMLCDYGAFDEEERWVKGIVKQICESRFAIRLSTLSASNKQWETEVGDMMYRLTRQFGYREDAVSDIFHKMCIGLGLVGVSYDWNGAFHVSSSLPVSQTSMPGSFVEPRLLDVEQNGHVCIGGHDYVDLGLPSGTLWATCNIGANKPEDYGNYYAWGETKPKNTYDWDTYKYANNASDKLTKYCNNSSYGKNGFTDDLTALQTGDDPATANWGNGWRTPSKEQWVELLANTTNQWTMKDGVSGRLFTSLKNTATLFLPVACDSWFNYYHPIGIYWSRSLLIGCPSFAWTFCYGSGGCFMNFSFRYSGFAVRPVRQN